MLSIVSYIKYHGLNAAVLRYKLKVKDYGHKIHLKYDQIESPMYCKEVQECRGLILEKDTLRVMSMSFFKFFNHGEGHAAQIDWDTAHVLKKLDGTMIQLYWDWHLNQWCAATTGTAEGEGQVNDIIGMTFSDLFWNTLASHGVGPNAFDKDYTYVFELTTPYNIVVVPHSHSKVTLLAIRHNETLKEIPYSELGNIIPLIDVVEGVPIAQKDFDTLLKTFENMPWSEEGYVVVDANFNRVKVKNPAYVAVHHLKSKTAEHHIMAIIKTNEVDEFIATFPVREAEVLELKSKYDLLITKLEYIWHGLQPILPTDPSNREQKKQFAFGVMESCAANDLSSFKDVFFTLQNNRVSSVKEYMLNFDNKRLYELL